MSVEADWSREEGLIPTDGSGYYGNGRISISIPSLHCHCTSYTHDGQLDYWITHTIVCVCVSVCVSVSVSVSVHNVINFTHKWSNVYLALINTLVKMITEYTCFSTFPQHRLFTKQIRALTGGQTD